MLPSQAVGAVGGGSSNSSSSSIPAAKLNEATELSKKVDADIAVMQEVLSEAGLNSSGNCIYYLRNHGKQTN